MLRSGHRPDGKPISPVMPFASLKQMNDTDVRALYAYLKTVPRARGAECRGPRYRVGGHANHVAHN
jgi:hypothetical protein